MKINELTPSSLSLLINQSISGVLAQHLPESAGLITVTGSIGDTGSRKGNWIYGIPLQDDGAIVLLDVPLHLGAGLAPNMHVVAVGALQVRHGRRGGVDVTLKVAQLSCVQKEANRKIANQGIEPVSALPRRKHRFPWHCSPVRITLVRSSSATAMVAEDCLTELRKLGGYAQIRQVEVDILNPAQIATAINGAGGDVLMLIRGGGDAFQFQVFNDPRVIQALAECPLYRVIGLGHSANHTNLDQIADYTAPTPAQAGLHVREMVEHGPVELEEHFEPVSGQETEAAKFEFPWVTAVVIILALLAMGGLAGKFFHLF